MGGSVHRANPQTLAHTLANRVKMCDRKIETNKNNLSTGKYPARRNVYFCCRTGAPSTHDYNYIYSNAVIINILCKEVHTHRKCKSTNDSFLLKTCYICNLFSIYLFLLCCNFRFLRTDSTDIPSSFGQHLGVC